MTKKKATNEDMNKMFENFEGDTGGFEDMTKDTESIPFVRLLQELSPQCRKTKEEYMEEAAPGMLFNSITGRLYPSPLRFVVGKFERYYLEWKPKRGGLAGVHAVDVIEKRIGRDLINDEGFKIVDPTTGNEFADTYVYYVLFPDFIEDGVCLFSMSSSFLKEAKKLNRNLRSTVIPGTTRRALPFFMIWNYGVKTMQKDEDQWFGPMFTLDGFVNQEQLAYVTEERAALPNKTINLNLLEEDAGKDKVVKDDGVPY